MAGLLGAFVLLDVAKGIYTEWLWFDSLGYGTVYATIIRARILIFVCAGFAVCALLLGNLALAARLAPKTGVPFWPWAIVGRLQKLSRTAVILGTVLLGLAFGLAAQDGWEIVLRFLSAQPFNVSDPVFHRDVGFYVFSLPFFRLLRSWFLGIFVVSLLGTIALYLISHSVQRIKFDFPRPVLAHISGLVIVILGFFAWGYWLDMCELVFSERGVVFGAGYADMHAKLPALWIVLSVVLACMGLVLVSALRHRFRWFLYGLGVWIVAAIVVGQMFPGLIQRFRVEPNELALEKPYIEYNIESTREAFALNRIEEQSFPAEPTPTAQDIAQNEVTINNIRLWDHRPLKDTYNQIQAMRLYYDFHDVD
ncbi:MAG: UPF0182 family protein, partial [Dehalococcoidia bacterium]|nr:UPF0182 family protein [Dehalococcoidia bacterium]